MKKETYLSLIGILILALTFSCSGGSDDDGGEPTPPPPVNTNPTRVSQLIFPTSDLLCIDNNITFEWSASTDADGDPISYTIVIATDRELTSIVSQTTVNTTSLLVTLQTGIAYYWNVTAKDNQGGEAEPSDTFAFYTEGDGVANHAPFTAALNAPENEGTVNAGTVNLSWMGGDTDTGDTLTYDIYFGETTDPANIETGYTTENYDVTVTSGSTYFWRVDSIDDSGLKTIGQEWTFTVN